MKILLVLNKPNREAPIMEAVRQKIALLEPGAEVKILPHFSPGFASTVLNFRPDVIVTYPFTCKGHSRLFYLFKALFKCRIISFRAEGMINVNSRRDLNWAAGFDDYGPDLVDYEVFWGPATAGAVGDSLVGLKKLAGRERTLATGYPRLERYFQSADLPVGGENLPERIISTLSRFERKDTVFFVTGFHLANYTLEDLYNAADLNASVNLEILVQAVDLTRDYRAAWVRQIRIAAAAYPDMLFVVKKHPIERVEDYIDVFAGVDNILYIHEELESHDIMPFAGLFFHYGSTTAVDSYLCKVPSVYVREDGNWEWYDNIVWPATLVTSIGGIAAALSRYRDGGLEFVLTEEMDTFMQDMFSLQQGAGYSPSSRLAELILARTAILPVKVATQRFFAAMCMLVVDSMLSAVSTFIKRMLGVPQERRLWQWSFVPWIRRKVCER